MSDNHFHMENTVGLHKYQYSYSFRTKNISRNTHGRVYLAINSQKGDVQIPLMKKNSCTTLQCFGFVGQVRIAKRIFRHYLSRPPQYKISIGNTITILALSLHLGKCTSELQMKTTTKYAFVSAKEDSYLSIAFVKCYELKTIMR